MAAPLAGIHLRPALADQASALERVRLALVTAPGGSGKTTLLTAWREALKKAGRATVWIAAAPAHSDPTLWIEDLVDSLASEMIAGGEAFAERVRRELPHVESAKPALLARQLRRACQRLEQPLTIFLDNYHLIEGAGAELIDALLRDESRAAPRFVIATRGAPPGAAIRLLNTEQALTVGADDLSLRANQIESLLHDRNVGTNPRVIAQLLASTGGWATGVLLASRQLASASDREHADIVTALSVAPDLFEYMANELLASEPNDVVHVLEISSVLGASNEAGLVTATGRGSEFEAVRDAVSKGLLLRDEDRLFVHHLWQEFLRRRLRERLTPEAWRELHRELGAGVADADPERAVSIYRAGGAAEALAEVLERHGLDWFERGRQRFVADALAEVPQALRDTRPTLALLDTLRGMPQNVDAGLDGLFRVAARFRELGDHVAESRVLHRGLIVAANENQSDWTLRFARGLMSLRRLVREPSTRALGRFGLAIVAALTGRYQLIDRLLSGIDLRALGGAERSAPVHAIGLLRRYSGEWDSALALIDHELGGEQPLDFPPAVESLRVSRALFVYARDGDAAASIRECEEARDALHDFGLTVSEAAACSTLALLQIDMERYEAALRELERSIALSARVGQWDREAHARSLRAIAWFRSGQHAAARKEAEAALAHYEVRPRRDLVRSPFAWEAAYAAWILAEVGGAARAREFMDADAAMLGNPPKLPLVQHAVALCLARVVHLEGDAQRAARHIADAWRAAAGADLRHYAPELTAELVAWGADMARELDIEPEYLATRGLEPAAPPDIAIDSLGAFEVRLAGEPVARSRWRGAQTRRLLLRLLAAGEQGDTRERLEADLWPDLPPEKSRNNLRVTLSRLRAAIDGESDDSWVQGDGNRLTLAPACFAGWDVAMLRAAIARVHAGDEAALDLTFEIYAGPFVHEIYDDWAEALRRELEASFVARAFGAAEEALGEGRPARAAALAVRLTSVAPALEKLWACRLEAELALGDRAAASASYELAVAALARELGSLPGPELERLGALARGAAPTG